MTKAEITEEMVERLTIFLQTEWAGPYMANIRDYLPEVSEPGSCEIAAIIALQAADRGALREARRMAREALRVALDG